MSGKNSVLRLCTQCKNIYTMKNGTDYFIGSVLTVSFMLMIATKLYEGDLSTLYTKVYLLFCGLMVAAGILLLYGHKKRQENCPLCDSEKTLIPLDTPKAQEIIQQNNLSVAE